MKALEYARDFNLSEILIVSDSKYVINGVTEWVAGWKRSQWRTSNGGHVKNRDLWEPLHQLHTELAVEWEWVKGHIGHQGNEIADRLATKGRMRALKGNYKPVFVSPRSAAYTVGGMLN